MVCSLWALLFERLRSAGTWSPGSPRQSSLGAWIARRLVVDIRHCRLHRRRLHSDIGQVLEVSLVVFFFQLAGADVAFSGRLVDARGALFLCRGGPRKFSG